jgi:hypothetical protein
MEKEGNKQLRFREERKKSTQRSSSNQMKEDILKRREKGAFEAQKTNILGNQLNRNQLERALSGSNKLRISDSTGFSVE